MTKTYEQMYAFCRGHYYCGDKGEDGGDDLWEPFENYDEDTIEEYIKNDVSALKEAIGWKE